MHTHEGFTALLGNWHLWILFGSYWIFSSAIGALNPPTASSGQFYTWFYKFSSTLAANVANAVASKVPMATTKTTVTTSTPTQGGFARFWAICLLLLLSASLLLVACQPVENSARDTAAALSGLLVAAQQQNQTSCVANPAQSTCQIINQGISAQNGLITAIETYCGWPVKASTPPTGKCVPVKSAQGALNAAIANAQPFITELQGVVK